MRRKVRRQKPKKELSFLGQWLQRRRAEKAKSLKFQSYQDCLRSHARRGVEIAFSPSSPTGRAFAGDAVVGEFPQHRQGAAIQLVNELTVLAQNEVVPVFWNLIRPRLDITNRRIEANVASVIKIGQELQPQIQPNQEVQIGESVKVEPPDFKVLRKETEAVVDAEAVQRKIWKEYLKVVGNLILAVLCQIADVSLIYLIMYACFEGTEGYSMLMAPFLTVAVMATIVWLAHKAVTSGQVLVWLGFLAACGMLGYLRLDVGGVIGKEATKQMDWSGLALTVLTVLPIPILAYLTAQALERIKTGNLRSAKLEKLIEPLRRPRMIAERVNQTVAGFEQSQANLSRQRQETMLYSQWENERERRQGLEALRQRAIEEIRQLGDESQVLLGRVVSLVLVRLRAEIFLYAKIMLDWSQEKPRLSQSQRKEGGDGRATLETRAITRYDPGPGVSVPTGHI